MEIPETVGLTLVHFLVAIYVQALHYGLSDSQYRKYEPYKAPNNLFGLT
jgi:hypothetical protein